MPPYLYPYGPILVGDDVELPDLQSIKALRLLRERILGHDQFWKQLLFWKKLLRPLETAPLIYFISNTWDPFFKAWKTIDQDYIFESRPEVMHSLEQNLEIARKIVISYEIPLP